MEQFVRENFENIRMRIKYEELLTLDADVYLVSSGPSYFVQHLASKFLIPDQRVLCSRYSFNEEGIISRCTSPVSGQGKGDFVSTYAKNYDLTVGIGIARSRIRHS